MVMNVTMLSHIIEIFSCHYGKVLLTSFVIRERTILQWRTEIQMICEVMLSYCMVLRWINILCTWPPECSLSAFDGGGHSKTKGEEALLIVTHFVSADYRWLQSVDGKESARILFKTGKGCDGYFTTDNILVHTTLAMDILDKHFLYDNHVLVFNDAIIHVKHTNHTPAAYDMSKNPSSTWGAVVTITDVCRNVMQDPTGKVLK